MGNAEGETRGRGNPGTDGSVPSFFFPIRNAARENWGGAALQRRDEFTHCARGNERKRLFSSASGKLVQCERLIDSELSSG